MSTMKHLKYILTGPKIGADMYFTHWLLFFKPFRLWFQKKKLGAIGKGSEIRPYCIIDGTSHVFIGENVIIPEGMVIATDTNNPESIVEIHDSALFGPRCAIYACSHVFNDVNKPIKEQGFVSAKTVIKEGAWLGINVVVMPGVTIGKNSVIGANSVVNKDIPDNCVAVGAPARVIKNLV